MSKYSHIITTNYLSVMNLETGEVTKLLKDHPKFTEAMDACRRNDFEAVAKLSVKNVINAFAAKTNDNTVTVVDGAVWYNADGQKIELHNAMTTRVLAMIRDGFDPSPLVAFMNNLMQNPSKASVDELYLFLEATELPITSDGCFIAYKMVNDDYTSIHDSKFMNKPDTVVSMPRNMVDDNRSRTCSQGLHFCSRKYLPHYGTGSGTRLLLVKINPADVVSIPSDYNNAKGRASKYLIWKDITEPGWREKYLNGDYTTKSVEVVEPKKVDSTANYSMSEICNVIRGFLGRSFGSLDTTLDAMLYSERLLGDLEAEFSEELDVDVDLDLTDTPRTIFAKIN